MKMSALSLPRKYLILITISILVLQSIFIETCSSEKERFNAERQKMDLLQNDIFTIYLNPQVENISVKCRPLRSNGAFDLTISTKYLDPYSTLGREVSAIWVQPSEPGIYNFTVNFVSNKSWEYMLGVYTRNFDFYREYYGQRISITNFYVELQPALTRHPGNWTINIILRIHSLSPSISYITLPTPVNSAILIAVVGFLAYIDIFILLDTYFKSKKEIVSHTRWIIVAVALLISAYVAYQTYNFATFTLSGGI